MSFFAVLFALLLEQLKPLPRDNWVHETLASWVRWTDRNFDAGESHHVKVVWLVSVLVPALAAGFLPADSPAWLNVLAALATGILGWIAYIYCVDALRQRQPVAPDKIPV